MGATVREKVKGSGKWWVYVSKGTQRTAWPVHSGRKEAEKVARGVQVQLDHGDLSVFAEDLPPVVVPTFAEVAKDWLARRPTLGHVRVGTEERHQSTVTNHLVPAFPGPITDLTWQTVEAFIQEKRTTLKSSSLGVYLTTLRLIDTYAVKHGLLNESAFKRVEWKAAPRETLPDPFTQEELSRILAAADALSSHLGLMLRAMAQSGMRPGEARGLQRGDFDKVAGTVAIRRTLDKKERSGPPKTLRSQRTASLILNVAGPGSWEPTAASTALLSTLAHPPVQPLDVTAPLFPSLSRPGTPMTTAELRYHWGRVLTRAKVAHRGPHHLRHTAVSILLDRGMPLKLVANQVGDSIATLAQHYAGAGDVANLPAPATQMQPEIASTPQLAVIAGGKP